MRMKDFRGVLCVCSFVLGASFEITVFIIRIFYDAD